MDEKFDRFFADADAIVMHGKFKSTKDLSSEEDKKAWEIEQSICNGTYKESDPE